jgi:hypothetical protein
VFVHSQYDKENPKNLMDEGSSQHSSLVMIGFVPAPVPLIEAYILITGIWFLEKTSITKWAWAPCAGY